MFSEEKQTILRVVERYIRTGSTEDDQVKVTCLPANKTSAMDQVNGESRSVMLDEYKVDGKSVWAGYSTRTGIVFLSLAGNQ
jgi:hypothetical protein